MAPKQKLKSLASKRVGSKQAGSVKGGFFGSLLKKVKKVAQS
jgi:hypothetical protein